LEPLRQRLNGVPVPALPHDGYSPQPLRLSAVVAIGADQRPPRTLEVEFAANHRLRFVEVGGDACSVTREQDRNLCLDAMRTIFVVALASVVSVIDGRPAHRNF
jgi:hypothetical protein